MFSKSIAKATFSFPYVLDPAFGALYHVHEVRRRAGDVMPYTFLLVSSEESVRRGSFFNKTARFTPSFWYENECLRQLNDIQFYEKIDTSPLTHECVKKYISGLQFDEMIDGETAKYLKENSPKPGRFYTIPKIHKQGHPGRPIVSSNSHPTERISQFVDHHLQPLVTKLPSYIKDTTHFLNKLNSIGQLPNGVLLVTLDVASLYTNIPHNDGIQACSDFLDKRVNPTIKTTRLCDLIRMILTNNTFTFDGQHYRQINGTAMGTKMAPSYANLFMGNFEQKALAAATHSPLIWWRYIDDIFLLWTHGEEKLNDFITYLNNLHPTIKFTSSFSYNEIPFLDVKVMLLNGRLETDLYVKPTDKHQYLLKSSCHPSHTKQSIPFSMALRLRRICSMDEFFNTRSDALTSHLIKSGYKYRFIKDEIDKVRQVGHEVPGVVVWPLYCEMRGDISSYKATLQSEGK